MMRRVAAAAIAGALLLVMLPPAYAQTGPTARITSPGEGNTLSGVVSVRGEGSAAAGVRRVELIVDDITVATKEPREIRTTLDVSYNWNTAQSLRGGIARNGTYYVRLVVTAIGGAVERKNISVSVDNGTQAPAGVTASAQNQSVSLSWAANPEPDIAGYGIEAARGGSWSPVARTDATAWAAQVAPGRYQYRVVAFRSSPSLPEGRPSDPSGSVTVTVSAPPPSGGSAGSKGPAAGDPRVFGGKGKGSVKQVQSTARRFAAGGVSARGLSLPGQVGLPSMPAAEPFKWGTYKEKLPYSLPSGGVALDAVPPRLAAISTTTVIPPDALRWVAAGALMIVVAALLQLLALRTTHVAAPSATRTVTHAGKSGRAALVLPGSRLPNVDFRDALIRVRRLQDRVRTAWSQARGR